MAPDRRDDPHGDRGFGVRDEVPEGIPEGDHPFADLEVLGPSQGSGAHAVQAGPEHGHVGGLVGTHELRLHVAAVGEGHQDALRPADHVVIGEDQPLVVDHEARPQSRDPGGLGASSAEHSPEASEEVVERIPHPNLLVPDDVHRDHRG
jgi:hypothetical protein